MSAICCAKLGDVADILSGFAFKSEGFNATEGMPLVRIRDVVRGRSETRYIGDYDLAYVVDDNDILIGMDGEFNVAKWKSGPALLNQRVCRIKAQRPLDNNYLLHYLPSVLKRIEDATPFVTVKHLSVKDLRDIEIPLPPLAEQRRIAAILDKAETLRAKRREALTKLDTLAQSIFLEMFGDTSAPVSGTETTTLEAVCKRVTDGTHQPPMWVSSGIPFLFVSNIVDGQIDFSTEKYISDDTYRELTRRCPVEVGDVLYTTVGSYGNAALVRTDVKFAFQRHIAHIKPNQDLIQPEFLAVMMNSSGVHRQADKLARGMAQKTINLLELKSFVILLPPMKQQQDFLAKVHKMDSTRHAGRRSATMLDEVFASIQHRAFRGAL
jgi:type I restriction enzyme S subunit